MAEVLKGELICMFDVYKEYIHLLLHIVPLIQIKYDLKRKLDTCDTSCTYRTKKLYK